MLTTIVDAILVLTLVEAVGLVSYHKLTGRGLAPAALLPNLAAGWCLMLGVRFALVAVAPAVLACLLAALVCHLADLAARWRADPVSPDRAGGSGPA